jgi:hypothetical protein
MTTFTTQDRQDAQRAPLTDEQLTEMHQWLTNNLSDMWANGQSDKPFFKEYARMIERAHGIGE